MKILNKIALCVLALSTTMATTSLKDFNKISKEVHRNINYTSHSNISRIDKGVPPKVYGMNYVKRGTHKRTNI